MTLLVVWYCWKERVPKTRRDQNVGVVSGWFHVDDIFSVRASSVRRVQEV
jgi:hypothetical protein